MMRPNCKSSTVLKYKLSTFPKSIAYQKNYDWSMYTCLFHSVGHEKFFTRFCPDVINIDLFLFFNPFTPGKAKKPLSCKGLLSVNETEKMSFLRTTK